MGSKTKKELDKEVFEKLDRLIQKAEEKGEHRIARMWTKRREIYASAGWWRKTAMLPLIRKAK